MGTGFSYTGSCSGTSKSSSGSSTIICQGSVTTEKLSIHVAGSGVGETAGSGVRATPGPLGSPQIGWQNRLTPPVNTRAAAAATAAVRRARRGRALLPFAPSMASRVRRRQAAEGSFPRSAL